MFGQLLLCDPTAGGFNVAMPVPTADDTGRRVAVKNVTANTNPLTVLPSSFYVGALIVNPLIDGAASSVLNSAYGLRIFTWLGVQYGWMVG
ncbi:MAG TPA: hypothetical protein VJV79_36495 [Polyangiaceae bacterium]|nr:hypothetical protein [Polyangiaceae bacterium]